MPSRPRNRERLRGPLLAGWLFADLMLLLFVVGLGFVSPEEGQPTPNPSPTASSTARPTVRPTATPTPTQRVLQKDYHTITVVLSFPITDLLSNQGNAVSGKLVAEVNSALDAYVALHPALVGKVVGAAAINGYGPFDATGTGITDGTNEAAVAARLLDSHDPDFYQASFLPGWSGGPSNALVMHVFFYS